VNKENGDIKLIEGFFVNITERKKAEEALRGREEFLRKENIRLRSNIKDRYKFANIIGKSAAMQEVYEIIIKAAAADAPVIIYGESGTGKELAAQAIHELSERNSARFVPVNCGAIPENLLESEFFGYKKGAFTGANDNKNGFLDLADKGTLFLDELGEIGPNLQVKLLRALDGGGFTPLGSRELRKPDFRIIAATNRDLKNQVRKGLMREDFFYRVNIIPVRMPPLRERKEDIPLLIEHFWKTSEYENAQTHLPAHIISHLLDYEWPGNVRELQNTLHRYAALNQLDFLGTVESSKKWVEPVEVDIETVDRPLHNAVAEFEKKYIVRLLEAHQWHRKRVASILGIGRRTLYSKMKLYGLKNAQNGKFSA
jgi:transcriptional regulator with PAS, ATPase and Fis domain